MKIVNLTGHDIDFAQKVKISRTDLPVPRLTERANVVGTVTIDGVDIPILQKEWGETINLPAPQPDTYYIVSALVANSNPNRGDLLVPKTTRTSDGRVVAEALIRNSPLGL